jgi:hypothetical protein
MTTRQQNQRTSIRNQGVRLTKAQRDTAQKAFLRAYASTSNIRASCMAAGVDRHTVWEWQERDLPFSILFTQAKEDANDLVRAEIWRRAMQGIEKPIISFGRVVTDDRGKPLTYKEPSDRLLEFLARSKMPEFRERQQLDVYTEIGTVAQQAKDTLLSDLAAMIHREQQNEEH